MKKLRDVMDQHFYHGPDFGRLLERSWLEKDKAELPQKYCEEGDGPDVHCLIMLLQVEGGVLRRDQANMLKSSTILRPGKGYYILYY